MLKFSRPILTLLLTLWLILPLHAQAGSPGTNKYAWAASLKVVKIFPLRNADPFSGVIITDWRSVTPGVRYKLDVYVLDGVLTATSVHVSVFKQTLRHGAWTDQDVSPEVGKHLEEAILNQAKKMRDTDYN